MNLRIFDFRNEEDIRNILVTPQIRSRFLRLKAGSEMNDFHRIKILHRHKKSDDNFDNKLKILRTENYGKSKIVFGKFI